MAEFKESNICPICGGRLIADNIVLTSNPPQYRATCEKCGKVFYSHHVIGFVDIPEIPDGMWCTDTNTKLTPAFVHEDTINSSRFYTVDADSHYTAISLTEVDNEALVKNYYNGLYYEYSTTAAEEAKEDYNIDIEEVIKNQINADLKKKENN